MRERKPITIAIIDSGIDVSVPDLCKFVKDSTGFKINDEGYIVEDKNKSVMHPHATIIAHIIKEMFSEIEFISVNILNERLSTDGRVLLYALQRTLEYKPDIIHLSLGTTRLKYILPLKKLVKRALRENISIVCAANNQGKRSYPAFLKGVFGVKADAAYKSENIGYRTKFYYAPLRAENLQILPERPLLEEVSGTSFSAAYITGHIAKMKYSNSLVKHEDIVNSLKSYIIQRGEWYV